MRLELSIQGTAGLVGAFHAADAQVARELRAATKNYGTATKELTQFLSPYRSGFMASKVRLVIKEGGFQYEVGWDAADFLGQGKSFYPFFQEYGTRNHPAQPSLGPAYRAIQPQYKAAIEDIIERGIERIGRGR